MEIVPISEILVGLNPSWVVTYSLLLNWRCSFDLKLYIWEFFETWLRNFLLEKAFICYFRHQETSPQWENFKLNPWLAALFLWHSRVNLDCESIWGPACGYEFSRELIYFPSIQWQIQNRHVSLLTFFVWQNYFSSTLWFYIYVEISCLLCSGYLSKKNLKTGFLEFVRNLQDSGTWVAQSMGQLAFDFCSGHGLSGSWDQPCIGLCTQCGVSFRILSLSLSLCSFLYLLALFFSNK